MPDQINRQLPLFPISRVNHAPFSNAEDVHVRPRPGQWLWFDVVKTGG
jgi:hypothetical protein